MSPYTEYKALAARLASERALHYRWTPEVEAAHEAALAPLWIDLTAEDRTDHLAWLDAREAESVDP
jgi:hypothetical protein